MRRGKTLYGAGAIGNALGIPSPKRVYDLAREGKIPTWKTGKHLTANRDELRRLSKPVAVRR